MIQRFTTILPLITGIIFFNIFSLSVFAQPSNDNCFNAASLTPAANCNPITGTVSGATQSIPGCNGTANDDVWYSFVANQPALGVQVTGATGFNPVLQVFSGGCSSSSSLGCFNNTGAGGTEIASFSNLIVGVTYWVRVYDFGAGIPSNPTFTICVSPQAVMPSCQASTPAGNTCSEAVMICDVNGYCGSTSASYTADFWPELNTAFCGSIENNSFIKFVANASTVSLNVWVTSSASNLGIQVMIFSANNCSGAVTTHTCVSPLAPSTAPSAVVANGLTPGQTYYMMIDGYSGDVCNYVIGVNSGIQVSGQITTPTTNVCLNTPVTLTASGGNGVYTWNPSPDLNTTTGSVVIATPTTQGAHTYTMTTNSSNPFCPSNSVSSITINAFAPPTPYAGIDDSVCFGNPIHLSGTQTSSANTMTWQYLATGITPTPTVTFSPNFSSLTPTVTVSQPGLYKFILRETNSVCGLNKDTVKVLVMNLQHTHFVEPPSCYGLADGEIHIVNPNADEFSFDNGVSWQSDSIGYGFAAGSYTVCSRNYLGCSTCSSVTVTNPPLIGQEVSNDTLICENGTASLSAIATGGTTFLYHWDSDPGTGNTLLVQPQLETEYIVFAENENGCISEADTITVSVRPPISGILSPDSFVCPGYSVDLVAEASGGNDGPYQFAWSNGVNQIGDISTITVSPTATTTYSVTISDACESTPKTLNTEVEVLPLPVPLITTLDADICEPAVFFISNATDNAMVNHLSWRISDGQQFFDQETIQTAPMDHGVYDVQLIVESPQGCIDSVTFYEFLTVHPKPIANFTYSPNPIYMFNTEVHLTNYSVNGASYQWYIEDGSPTYSEQVNVVSQLPDGETGNYNVMLITTSEFECIDTMTQIITVVPEILLYAPNTFTPDDDEHNQSWGVEMEGLDPYDFELLIYNRWGQIIWESHDPEAKWDGTYNGTIVQAGTYTWVIRAKDKMNDAAYTFNGYINVIK